MTEERNRATFRDYLATLRRRKLVVLGVMIVAAAAAGALALTQPKTYSAQSSLNPLDLSQTSGFANIQQSDPNVPATTAAQLAQVVTRSDVIQAVKDKLQLAGSLDHISSKLSVSEDQQSNFVLINASASTAAGAASLANTVATTVANISNQQVRTRFAGDANADAKAATALLAPFGGKKYSQLPASQQATFQTNSQEATQLDQLAARLQAFSKVATVAQVENLASVPTSPSGPHPVSTAILGAILGLIIAMFVVWFLESLDRRLRRPDEAAAVLGLPVVGAVPPGSLGQTPGRSTDAVALPAFRMIRTQMRFLGSGDETDEEGGAHEDEVRSILVTSAQAGEGKTTISFGLALSAAASGLTTLLIEADVHRPVHAKRLGLNTGPGLGDYLSGKSSPGEILQSYRFADPTVEGANGSSANGHGSTLTCITAGNVSGFRGAEPGGQRFAEVISEVRSAYDLVVIDSAPLLAVAETSEIAALVDAIVFCLRLGATTAEQARAARAALGRLPKRPTGLVLTDLARDAGGYYGYAYEYSGSPERAESA